jgi:hypothetical protein
MVARRKNTTAIIAAGANRVITNMVADSPARKTTYLGTARGYPADSSHICNAFCRIYSQPCPKPQNTTTLIFEKFPTFEYLYSPLW